MSKKDDTERAGRLASFAEQARCRCGAISIGLEAKTSDLETLRAEAHALKEAAMEVDLRRLAELAGLMESELAEGMKAGALRGRRADQLADAAGALAEGASAAAAQREEPPEVGLSLARLFGA